MVYPAIERNARNWNNQLFDSPRLVSPQTFLTPSLSRSFSISRSLSRARMRTQRGARVVRHSASRECVYSGLYTDARLLVNLARCRLKNRRDNYYYYPGHRALVVSSKEIRPKEFAIPRNHRRKLLKKLAHPAVLAIPFPVSRGARSESRICSHTRLV